MKPRVVEGPTGQLIVYPDGFRGPYAANPFGETDATVLARVVGEIREHFAGEDETNVQFASFLRDLDRLDALARQLAHPLDLATLTGRVLAAA